MLKRRILGFFCGLLIVGVVSTVTGVARAADACDATELSKIFALTGYVVDGACVPTLCEDGYELADKSCNKVGEACARDALDEAHAMVGYLDNGGVCVPTACLNGYVLEEKQCVKRGNGCSAAALEAINASAGYWLDNACTATVCLNGFVLDNGVCTVYSSNQGGGSGTPVVADCGKNLFNPQLLKEGGLTYNSTNYTFSGRLTRDYQNATKKNTGDFTANHYMSNYSYGLLPKTTYKLVYTIKCDTDSNSVKAQDMIIGLKTKSGNTVNNVAPTVGACTNDKVTVTVSAGNSTTDVVGVYVGRASGVTKDYDGELNISNVMLVLNTESTSSMIPYGPCIKVSTKASTSRREAGVESRLGNLRDMINHLITRTQSSAVDINTLDSGKQTRPADEATDDCQAGDTCLLIKDVSGANHWYRIETCNENDFLADVGSAESITIGGQSYGAVNGCTSSETSVLGCSEGEVVVPYENGIVFIEQISLNIAEGTGSVVSLPSNVTGETSNAVLHHLCRVTGYRVKNGDGTLQSRQNVDTNLWIVDDTAIGSGAGGGNCYRYMNGASNILAYYASIANTCSATASGATMCAYNHYLDLVVENAPQSGVDGYITAQGSGYTDDICSGSPDTLDSGWCTTANELANHGSWNYNTWIAELPSVTLSGTGNPNVPEIYGRAYCTELDGTSLTQYSMLNQNEIGTVDPDGVLDSTATCVCTVTGYRNAGAATITPVAGTDTTNNTNYTKYLFAGTTHGKCNYECQKMCAEAFSDHANNNLMRYLANSCAAN